MGALIPAAVWLISAFICEWIARKRNLRQGSFRILLVVILGPLAIPLMFLFRPK